MNIDHIQLPPVSEKFYTRIKEVFPAINPLDIHKDTNMIDIQRNAAQQEVIEYIGKYVRKEESTKEDNFLNRLLKYMKN